jgi:hypothetical protein
MIILDIVHKLYIYLIIKYIFNSKINVKRIIEDIILVPYLLIKIYFIEWRIIMYKYNL